MSANAHGEPSAGTWFKREGGTLIGLLLGAELPGVLSHPAPCSEQMSPGLVCSKEEKEEESFHLKNPCKFMADP